MGKPLFAILAGGLIALVVLCVALSLLPDGGDDPTPFAVEPLNQRIRVANTGPGRCANGSLGAYIHREPNGASPIKAYCDGEPMVTIGPSVSRAGTEWLHVSVYSDGNEGWIPMAYTEVVE